MKEYIQSRPDLTTYSDENLALIVFLAGARPEISHLEVHQGPPSPLVNTRPRTYGLPARQQIRLVRDSHYEFLPRDGASLLLVATSWGLSDATSLDRSIKIRASVGGVLQAVEDLLEERYTRRYLFFQAEGFGGLNFASQAGSGGILLTVDPSETTALRFVLAHELAHLFQSPGYIWAPVWFVEGSADALALGVTDGSRSVYLDAANGDPLKLDATVRDIASEAEYLVVGGNGSKFLQELSLAMGPLAFRDSLRVIFREPVPPGARPWLKGEAIINEFLSHSPAEAIADVEAVLSRWT